MHRFRVSSVCFSLLFPPSPATRLMWMVGCALLLCAAHASGGPGRAPVAAFSASPTRGQAPLAVAFTDASTGRIRVWAWDFLDGIRSTPQLPTHTYTTPGTYRVRLTVPGPDGLILEVHTTPKVVTDNIYTIQLTEHFLAMPLLLATMQTTNDGAPATLRGDDTDPVEVHIHIEEAAAASDDLHHVPEVAGSMAFTYQ